MLTDDIRLERIEGEYQTTRATQDKLMDRMNGVGDVLQSLAEQVAANAQAIEANRVAIEALRDETLAVRRAVAENSQMLSDIMEHLQVPKKRTGFLAAED